MTRFSLDVDGVVADYRRSMAELNEHLGIGPLRQPTDLEPEALDAFMEERQATIRELLNNWIKDHLEEFWGGMASLVSDEDRRAINRAAAQGHELFWVSARPSQGRMAGVVAAITLSWLQQQVLPADVDHVLLAPKKSKVLTAHHIQHHLDDIVPYATEIALNSQTKVYLLRQPWNRHMIFRHPGESEYTAESGAFGFVEVDSIAEYITLITGDAR